MMLASGQLMICKEEGPNACLQKGAILGIEQFLFNAEWNNDIYCREPVTVLMLQYNVCEDL